MPPRPDKKRQVESARKKLRSGERSTKAPAPKKKSFGVNVKDAAIGAAIGALGATGAGKGIKVAKGLSKATKAIQSTSRAIQSGRLYRANQVINAKDMKTMLKGLSKEQITRSNRKAAVDLARKGMIQKSGTAVRGTKGGGYGSGLRKDDISTAIRKAKISDGIGKSRYNKLIDGGRK